MMKANEKYTMADYGDRMSGREIRESLTEGVMSEQRQE